MRFFLRYFLRGLLFVIPVASTIWILLYGFNWIGGLVNFEDNLGWEIPWINKTFEIQGFLLRALGFVAIIAGVTGTGILTSSVISGWILRRIDELFSHLPIVKQIYSSIKDMVEAFVSEEKKFDKPVLLSLTEAGDVEVLGFVTREDLSEFGRKDKVAVYVPQSYNFAANLLVVPKTRVTPVDLPAGDVMAFVVSGGVSQATLRPEVDSE